MVRPLGLANFQAIIRFMHYLENTENIQCYNKCCGICVTETFLSESYGTFMVGFICFTQFKNLMMARI